MLNHPIYFNTSHKISLSYSRKNSSNLSKNVPKRVSHSGGRKKHSKNKYRLTIEAAKISFYPQE